MTTTNTDKLTRSAAIYSPLDQYEPGPHSVLAYETPRSICQCGPHCYHCPVHGEQTPAGFKPGSEEAKFVKASAVLKF